MKKFVIGDRLSRLLALALALMVSAADPSAVARDDMKVLPRSAEIKAISLKQAIDRALAGHTSIQLAKNLLEQRKAQRAIAVGAILPKLRLSGGYTKNIPEIKTPLQQGNNGADQDLTRQVAFLLGRDGSPDAAEAAQRLESQADLMLRRSTAGQVVMNPKDVFEGRISMEVPLFSAPDVARIMQSKAGVDLQNARLSEEKARTIHTAAKAFYAAYHLKNLLALKAHSLKGAKERSLRVRERFNRGLLNEKDLLLSRADLLEAEAGHVKAELEYRSAIGELGLIIGMSEEFAIEDPQAMSFDVMDFTIESLLEIAMKHRADLKAAQEAVVMADKDRLSSAMQFLPKVSAQGQINFTSNDRGLSGEPVTAFLSINATMSLFEGGTRISSLRESALKRQEAVIRLEHLKRDIRASVRGHKEKIAELLLKQRALSLKVKATKELEKIALGKYDSGLIAQEDLLKAIEDRLTAQIGRYKAEADLNTKKLDLTFAAGLLTPRFVQ